MAVRLSDLPISTPGACAPNVFLYQARSTTALKTKRNRPIGVGVLHPGGHPENVFVDTQELGTRQAQATSYPVGRK